VIQVPGTSAVPYPALLAKTLFVSTTRAKLKQGFGVFFQSRGKIIKMARVLFIKGNLEAASTTVKDHNNQ
jgi:hypothetical protein